jgi:hypothetical protein
VTWKALNHLNLLPLLGVTMTENKLVMVSELMLNDNVMEFMGKNPNVDRLALVCSRSPLEIFISLLTNVRDGIS